MNEPQNEMVKTKLCHKLLQKAIKSVGQDTIQIQFE